MDGQVYQQFFLQPTDTWHRRYEALRSVFVERRSLSEVADRFGVRYGTVCNWLSEFRGQYDREEPPPFSSGRTAGGLWVGVIRRTSRLRLPMPRRCLWSKDGGCTHVRRVCSCSCRCLPGCGSTAS